MSDPSEEQFEKVNPDQEGERLILAASEAIRNLVADRRSLRNTVAAQERELLRLRASKAELWRHVAWFVTATEGLPRVLHSTTKDGQRGRRHRPR
jgi:hypothetical protein